MTEGHYRMYTGTRPTVVRPTRFAPPIGKRLMHRGQLPLAQFVAHLPPKPKR
jgi:hypothetical protein